MNWFGRTLIGVAAVAVAILTPAAADHLRYDFDAGRLEYNVNGTEQPTIPFRIPIGPR